MANNTKRGKKTRQELKFTLTELLRSDTATANKIANTPTTKELDNLLNLIYYVLQPLREKLGKPIIITSGFRCSKVNQMVGGASNSQHKDGEACDMYVKGMTIQQLFDFIKHSGIAYDQLINEYNQWVHISYRHGKNRRQDFKL